METNHGTRLSNERNSLSESVKADILEWHCEIVVQRRDVEHWKSLKHFWEVFSDVTQYECGRLHIRHEIADLMMTVVSEDPYEGEITNEGESANVDVVPLAKWDPNRWENLATRLQSLRDKVVRKDADVLITCEEDMNNENDPGREDSKLFGGSLESLLRIVKANNALSSFRGELEAALKTNPEVTPSVGSETLSEFREIVSNTEDPKLRSNLESLLRPSTDGKRVSPRSNGLVLESPYQLKHLLGKKPFNLRLFQEYFQNLLLHWKAQAFEDTPNLCRLQYMMPESVAQNSLEFENEENTPPVDDAEAIVDVSAEQSKLEELRAARKRLVEDVQDPLEESCAIAATAAVAKHPKVAEGASPRSPARRNPSSLYDRKKSARRIVFEDSEDSDTVEEDRTLLSALPERVARVGGGGREGRGNNSPKFTPRRPFSAEEKLAIRRGVIRFGVGRWSNIKSYYSLALQHRTGVQIKDCYRTMLKRGEI